MRTVLLASTLLAACDADLERMIDQPRYSPYEACDICPGGTIMMQPPEGTVSRSAPLPPREIGSGRTATGYVETLPVHLDTALLVRGRNRFDIYCAACHGRLGDGDSQVAENMTLRKPPSLLDPAIVAYPPGRLYAVVTGGFGLMRSYAAELPLMDRWAVVAYVQALQLSQHVALDQLPATLHEEARPWLK